MICTESRIRYGFSVEVAVVGAERALRLRVPREPLEAGCRRVPPALVEVARVDDAGHRERRPAQHEPRVQVRGAGDDALREERAPAVAEEHEREVRVVPAELLAHELDPVERREVPPRPQHADPEVAEARGAVPAVVVGRDRDADGVEVPGQADVPQRVLADAVRDVHDGARPLRLPHVVVEGHALGVHDGAVVGSSGGALLVGHGSRLGGSTEAARVRTRA
jgi:hypothetical protein